MVVFTYLFIGSHDTKSILTITNILNQSAFNVETIDMNRFSTTYIFQNNPDYLSSVKINLLKIHSLIYCIIPSLLMSMCMWFGNGTSLFKWGDPSNARPFL